VLSVLLSLRFSRSQICFFVHRCTRYARACNRHERNHTLEQRAFSNNRLYRIACIFGRSKRMSRAKIVFCFFFQSVRSNVSNDLNAILMYISLKCVSLRANGKYYNIIITSTAPVDLEEHRIGNLLYTFAPGAIIVVFVL